MSETGHNVEEFIDKLHKEGVQTARLKADEILKEARSQAQQILESADTRAGEIVEAAELKAEKISAKTQSEIQLALRDAVLRLQQNVLEIVLRILKHNVENELRKSDFIRELVRVTVLQYAHASANRHRSFSLVLPEDMQKELIDEVIAELRSQHSAFAAGTGLAYGLRQAGFEYSDGDGVIEVTVDSVSEVLAELVGPELQELLKVIPVEKKKRQDESLSGSCGLNGWS